MLTQIAEGVVIHASEFLQSNAVVVQGDAGVLLIDAGVQSHEMACLANDLREWGQPVVAGFSTHPHWDHLLWDSQFGSVPRYGTARCASTARKRLSDPGAKARVAQMLPPDIADQVPLDLLGAITGLPDETAQIPWDGPAVQVVEHQGHAPGHAALLIEQRGVLVAGDMLSDVLIPMLDVSAADPIEDYLAGLRLLEDLADGVGVVIPGHGSVGSNEQVGHGSDWTAHTSRPCVTATLPMTRASGHRWSPAGSGSATYTEGRPSASPREAIATRRPASVPAQARVSIG